MKERILKIMDNEGMSLTTFADFLDINQQTMIATLKRNKTVSSVIITAILDKFPNINSDWLLRGKEPMYTGDRTFLKAQPSLFENTDVNAPDITKRKEYAPDLVVKAMEKELKKTDYQPDISQKKEDKKVEKIIIFYTDKTFVTLTPEE